MKTRCLRQILSLAVMSAGLLVAVASSAQPIDWNTAVNDNDEAPDGRPGSTFFSYNQPSLNDDGMIVFRARSRVGTGSSVTSGIYRLDLFDGVVERLFVRGDAVPDPNNTLVNGELAAFNDFPSTPRIDPNGTLAASRGQHAPVWTYLVEDGETRVGTAGVYVFPLGEAPLTGASQLGAATELDGVTLSFPWFSVPETTLGTRFDQFPGAPAVSEPFIIYKGNYTDVDDGLGRTGIYFRNMTPMTPIPFTGMVASSETRIPNQPMGGETLFGSTAPPSAADGWVFFVGFDIEEAPTLGGVYRAPIAPTPGLDVIAGVGEQVPGEPPGTTFRAFGEGLSVSSDAGRVAFWGTWGMETFEKLLECPVDGNVDLIAFCNLQHPDGLVVEVPVNQGFFVHDLFTGRTWQVARTGKEGLEDMLFWGFSGRPPGVGDSEDAEELARWRSSAFGALSSGTGQPSLFAFKAERDGTSGIYLREGLGFQLPLRTVAEVGTTPGQELDPEAPVDSFVSEVGIERDGYRNNRLGINAAMLFEDPIDPEESIGFAGMYYADVFEDLIFQDGFEDPITTN